MAFASLRCPQCTSPVLTPSDETYKCTYCNCVFSCTDELASVEEKAISLFELMPALLAETAYHLDRAEHDFGARAFAPFWDSIEQAARSLGRFDENTRALGDASTRYQGLVAHYKGSPPPFPVATTSISRLDLAATLIGRMEGIVRGAQRDFQFASIYEQRKTNQILVAGFRSLAHALQGMSAQLATSLQELSFKVDSVRWTIDSSMGTIDDRLVAIGQDFSKATAERSSRERTALEMLDNIQRHKRLDFWEGPRP